MKASDILRAVAEAGEVTVESLQGPSRAREFSYPRHVAVVLLRDRCGYSFYRIAALMGKRHIQTVIEAYWRTKARLGSSLEHDYLVEEAETLLAQFEADTGRMAERTR